MPCAVANRSARSRLRDPTATSCARVCWVTADANVEAMPPAPRMPQRIGGAVRGSGVRAMAPTYLRRGTARPRARRGTRHPGGASPYPYGGAMGWVEHAVWWQVYPLGFVG